jgi:hypothetical protein
MDYRELEEDIIEKYWKATLQLNREQRIVVQKQSNGTDYDSSKLESLEHAVSALAKELRELPEKPATQTKKDNLVRQIHYIYQKLELKDDGCRITRNKGMALPNYIYGDILNDL